MELYLFLKNCNSRFEVDVQKVRVNDLKKLNENIRVGMKGSDFSKECNLGHFIEYFQIEGFDTITLEISKKVKLGQLALQKIREDNVLIDFDHLVVLYKKFLQLYGSDNSQYDQLT